MTDRPERNDEPCECNARKRRVFPHRKNFNFLRRQIWPAAVQPRQEKLVIKGDIGHHVGSQSEPITTGCGSISSKSTTDGHCVSNNSGNVFRKDSKVGAMSIANLRRLCSPEWRVSHLQ